MSEEKLVMAIGAYVDGKFRNVYDTGLKTVRGAPVYVCIDRGHECAVYTTRVMRKRIGRTHPKPIVKTQKIRGRVVTQYRAISLSEGLVVNGKTIHYFGFHRLVCHAFHGAPPGPDMEVDHIDHNPSNNHPSNLRWLSVSENRKNRRHWLVVQRAKEVHAYRKQKQLTITKTT